MPFDSFGFFNPMDILPPQNIIREGRDWCSDSALSNFGMKKVLFTKMGKRGGERKFDLLCILWDRVRKGNLSWRQANFWNLVYTEEIYSKHCTFKYPLCWHSLKDSRVSRTWQIDLGARNLWILCLWLLLEDRIIIYPSLQAKAKEASIKGQRVFIKAKQRDLKFRETNFESQKSGRWDELTLQEPPRKNAKAGSRKDQELQQAK